MVALRALTITTFWGVDATSRVGIARRSAFERGHCRLRACRRRGVPPSLLSAQTLDTGSPPSDFWGSPLGSNRDNLVTPAEPFHD